MCQKLTDRLTRCSIDEGVTENDSNDTDDEVKTDEFLTTLVDAISALELTRKTNAAVLSDDSGIAEEEVWANSVDERAADSEQGVEQAPDSDAACAVQRRQTLMTQLLRSTRRLRCWSGSTA